MNREEKIIYTLGFAILTMAFWNYNKLSVGEKDYIFRKSVSMGVRG